MVKIICNTLIVLCFFNANAQDIKFSQFISTPLAINPANTGTGPGDFRAGAIYRSQWFGNGFNPYVTASGFYDMTLWSNEKANNQLGGGIVFIHDNAGNGDLTNLRILASIAFHKALDANNKHILSLGVGGGYVQKQVNYSNFVFDNQWTNTGFDNTIATGETSNSNSISSVDFQAGLKYNAILNDGLNFNIGFSAFHLSQPTESILSSNFNKNMKLNTTARANINLGEKLILRPSLLNSISNKVIDSYIGTLLAIKLSEHKETYNTFYFGGWYEISGNIIPMIGLEYAGFNLGISYDINSYSARKFASGNGSIEISLIYNGFLGKPELSRSGLGL